MQYLPPLMSVSQEIIAMPSYDQNLERSMSLPSIGPESRPNSATIELNVWEPAMSDNKAMPHTSAEESIIALKNSQEFMPQMEKSNESDERFDHLLNRINYLSNFNRFS